MPPVLSWPAASGAPTVIRLLYFASGFGHGGSFDRKYNDVRVDKFSNADALAEAEVSGIGFQHPI
jgi:hypothetical protein